MNIGHPFLTHIRKRYYYHQWCALPFYKEGPGHTFAIYPSQVHHDVS